MPSAIPPNLLEPVLAKAGEGLGYREIAEWLGREHAVTVSHMAVARLVQRQTSERAQATKAIVRTKLTRTVTTDIDRLELFARKAMRIARTVENEPETWCKVAREVRGFLEAKLKLCGADTPDDSLSELAAAERRLAGKFARFVGTATSLLEPADGAGEGSAGVPLAVLGESEPASSEG